MSKLGSEPDWIFVNSDVVSELLTENNIPDNHPQHDFYKQYILDKLKGSWFQSPKEMQEAVLKYVPKTASLNLRKKIFGQEEEPHPPEFLVTKQELIRLYTQEAKGIYDVELMDEIIAGFIVTLQGWISWCAWDISQEEEKEMVDLVCAQCEEQKKLVQILESAKTPQEKMIAIDQVIHTAHMSGVYGEYLIEGIETGDTSFLDELGNLKISSLNFRKKLSITEPDTLQENFYEPEISDEYPKGPKSPKQRRFPFHNYPPDDQGNIINIDPNVSNPMEYDTTPGPNPQGPGIFGNLSMKKAESGIDRVLNELMELPFIIKTAEDVREFVNDAAKKMEVRHHLVNGLILGHPDKFPESFTRNWISYVMEEYGMAAFSKELATELINEAMTGKKKKKEPLTEEKPTELPSEISELTKIDPKTQTLLHTYTNEEIWDIASGRKTDVTEEEIEQAKYVITKGIVASRLSMRKFFKTENKNKSAWEVVFAGGRASQYFENEKDADEFIDSGKNQEWFEFVSKEFVKDIPEGYRINKRPVHYKEATSVSEPTSDDSLHEQQGEQESWHTYFQGDDRWKKREPGQGFDIPFPSKERIKRSPWPFDDTTPTSTTMASLNMRKGKGLKEHIREQIEKQFIIPQQLKLRFDKFAQITELDVGDVVEFDAARYFRVDRHQSGGVLRGKGIVTEKNEDGSYNIEIQEVTEANENIAHIFKPGLITPFFPDEIKSVTPKFEPEEIPEEELKVKLPEMAIEEEEKEEEKPSDATKGLMEWMPGILKPIFEEEPEEKLKEKEEEIEPEKPRKSWKEFWKEWKGEAIKSLKRPVSKPFGSRLNMRESDIQKELLLEDLSPEFKSGDEIKHKLMGEAVYKVVNYDPKTDEYLVIGGVEDRELKIDREELENRCEIKLSMRKKAVLVTAYPDYSPNMLDPSELFKFYSLEKERLLEESFADEILSKLLYGLEQYKRVIEKELGQGIVEQQDLQEIEEYVTLVSNGLTSSDLNQKVIAVDQVVNRFHGDLIVSIMNGDRVELNQVLDEIAGIRSSIIPLARLSMRKIAIIEEHEYKVHEGKVPTYTFIGYQEDEHGGETVMVNCDICGSTLMLIPEEIKTNINRISKLPRDWERVVAATKLNMRKTASVSAEELRKVYELEPVYRELKQKYDAGQISDEEGIQLNQIENELNSLTDEVVRNLMFFFEDWMSFYKRSPGAIRGKQEYEVIANMGNRWKELNDAIDIDSKMIAIDNVINMMHVDFPLIRNLMEEYAEQTDEDPQRVFEEWLSLEDFLKEQGKLKLETAGLNMRKAQYSQPLTDSEKTFVLDFVQKVEIASDTEQIKEELQSDKFYIDLINHLENILNIPEDRSNDLALAIWNRLQRDLYLFAQPESGFIEANLNSDMKFSAKYKGPIISILEDIAQDVWNAPDLETAKKIVLDKVEPSNIDEDDKQTIINNVNRIDNLLELQKYIANSILFYEGMGTKLSMRKITKVLSDSGMWAIYNGEVFVNPYSSIGHSTWFDEIGLPIVGSEFDHVTRGTYRKGVVVWFEGSGTFNEFSDYLSVLLSKIGYPSGATLQSVNFDTMRRKILQGKLNFRKKKAKVFTEGAPSKTGSWAIYNGDIYIRYGQSSEVGPHAIWFEEIGLPPSGEAFDNVVRGYFEPDEITWYGTGDQQEFINHVGELRNTIGFSEDVPVKMIDMYTQQVTTLAMRKKASILDYPHKHLDTAMWDLSEDLPKLKENIKGLIIERFLNYLREEGKLNNPELWVTGFYYTGSTATQRYRPVSDIDIHVKVDWEKFKKANPDKAKDSIEEMHKELLSVFWNTLNKETLPDTEHPLTYYVLSEREDVFELKEEAYDILNDSWIVPPQKMPENFNVEEKFELLREQAELIMEKLDKALGEAKRNFIDYKILKELLDSYEGDKKDIEEIVKEKLEQVESDLEKLQEENAKIHDERQKSFHDGEEPIEEGLSQNWAPGNIKFKMIERYRYMDVLRKIKHIIEDKKITEEEEEKLEDLLEPRLSMKKKAAKRAIWAIYQENVHMTYDFDLHAVWFDAIDFPAVGKEFDKVARGSYFSDFANITWYENTGVFEDFVNGLPELIEKLNAPADVIISVGDSRFSLEDFLEPKLSMRKLSMTTEEKIKVVQEKIEKAEAKGNRDLVLELRKILNDLIVHFSVRKGSIPNPILEQLDYPHTWLPKKKKKDKNKESSLNMRKRTYEVPSEIIELTKMDPDMHWFLRRFTDDEIWDIASGRKTDVTEHAVEMAKKIINEGIVANRLSMRKKADLKNTILSLLLIGTTIPSIANVLGVPQNQIEQTIQESPEYFEEAKLQAVPGSEEFEIPEYKVTGTIYHATPEQTSPDPEYTADMTKIDPGNVPTAEGERIIALSRDLLKKFTPDAPFDYGDRVLIEGADEMDGIWVVHDTMHSRFINTIDFLVPEDMETGKWENIIIQKMQIPLAVLSMRKNAISDMEIPENYMVKDKTDKKLRRKNPPRHDKNDSIVEHNIDPRIDVASLSMRKANDEFSGLKEDKKSVFYNRERKKGFEGQPLNYRGPSILEREDQGPDYPSGPGQAEIEGTADDDSWGESNKLKKRRPTKEKAFPDFNIPYGWPGGEVKQL